MTKAAAFWIIGGEPYLSEAVHSAKSLGRHMPDVTRVLLIAGYQMRDVPKGIFDDVIGLANPGKGTDWYWYSIAAFEWAARNLCEPLLEETPDVLINLDCDTFVVGAFYDLLEVLNRFDIVGTYAPARYTSRTVGLVPDAFAELNIGMLAFRNSDKMRRVLAEWRRRYDDHREVYANNDQASLRETLWTTEEDVRIWVAPPEYNFRFPFGGFARYPVKVLHGRPKQLPIEEVARRVNDPTALGMGMRTWKKGEL